MTGRSIQRYFWIIPLVMMGLAVLACSPPPFEAVQVTKVRADPTTPGKVYVQLNKVSNYSIEAAQQFKRVYESVDYGQIWTPTTTEVDFSGEQTGSLTESNETFFWNGRAFWTFPRPTFRYFFVKNDANSYSSRSQFRLTYPATGSVSDADPHIIYIALGTEGVLVGPSPANPPPPDRTIEWKIQRTGLSELQPLPLTITNPLHIFIVVLCALVVPPLPLLHGMLLHQIYRYAYQPGERRAPILLAAAVTAAITGCAALAIVFWLVNVETDYYPVVSVMGGVCVAFSIAGGVWIARRRKFSDQFTWRIALASGLVALIVPLGVATIYIGWPFIISALLLFVMFQRMTQKALERQNAVATNWNLDRFTLEVCAAVAFMALPISLVTIGALAARGLDFVLLLPITFIVISISVTAVYAVIQARGRFALNKKSGVEGNDIEETPLFQGFRWWRRLFAYAAVWAIASGILSTGVYVAQAQVAVWFSNLLT